MQQRLTYFDIYDIFTFPEDGDLCQFDKFNLTKEEFLAGKFFGNDSMLVKNYLFYFYMPSNNEITKDELAGLFEILKQALHLKGLLWGCSSDDEIEHYEVFLIKTFKSIP